MNTFFSAIQRVSTSITDVIPDWYEYDYDGDDLTSIGDGGIDMFDDGNRVLLCHNLRGDAIIPEIVKGNTSYLYCFFLRFDFMRTKAKFLSI